MPALHISLGTYLKFFNMLELNCRSLDIKILVETAVRNHELDDDEQRQHIEAFNNIHDLERTSRDCEDKITLVHQATAMAILKEPEKETEIREIYEPRITYLHKKLREKVKHTTFSFF